MDVPHLRGHRSYYIIHFSDRPHPPYDEISKINALVNLLSRSEAGPTRAFDKGIDQRPFSQDGAFDTAPFRSVNDLIS